MMIKKAKKKFKKILNKINGSLTNDQRDLLIDELNELIAPHEQIQADDDQYEDPKMWWSIPLRDQLKQAQEDLRLR